ncbi:MAG: DUF1178 family protein [Comamonadaceae bacterium]|nr:DUF1178 family protein [Comamonadaceae bacterium]
MKVLDLHCDNDHVFEGWFASMEDYQGQAQRGVLQCPICGSSQVQKALSAPHVKAKSNRSAGSKEADASDAGKGRQARWLAHMRQMVREGESVGERFAQEARRIHEGNAPERLIHGKASGQEVVELLQEGIPVLPLPPAITEPLQ